MDPTLPKPRRCSSSTNPQRLPSPCDGPISIDPEASAAHRAAIP
jgi:hypothetical protein